VLKKAAPNNPSADRAQEKVLSQFTPEKRGEAVLEKNVPSYTSKGSFLEEESRGKRNLKEKGWNLKKRVGESPREGLHQES